MVEFLGPMHWFTLIKGSDSGGEAKQTEDFPRQAVCVLPCWCLVWPTEEHTSAAIYPQSSVKKGFGVFFGRKGRKNHDIVLSSDNIMKILIKLTLLTSNGQAKGIPDICLALVPFIN